MRRRAFLAGLLAVAVALGGCATATAQPVGSTAVVGGPRSGSAAPTWVPELDRALDRGIASGETWTFVSADGQPRIIGSVPLVSVGANDLAVAADRDAFRSRVQGLLATPAAAPEADPLAALSLAVRSLADQPAPHRIVLVDSLLQTTSPLRFPDRDGALLGADPAEIADRLAAGHLLPDLTGVEVTVIGAGDTAAPQRTPAPPTRTALLALWTELLERAGAGVRVVDTPLTTPPPAGLPPVTPVPVPQVPTVVPDRPMTVSLPDQVLGFLPDRAEFRDPAAAADVLAPFSDAMATGRFRLDITGTTSSAGTDQGRVALSRDRAALVAILVLRASGAAPELVTITAAGSDFPGFRPDRDATGRLDPIVAAANRQVILRLLPR